MTKYEIPMAQVIHFETVDVITSSSTVEPIDTPDKLSTWGEGIGKFASAEYNLFK